MLPKVSPASLFVHALLGSAGMLGRAAALRDESCSALPKAPTSGASSAPVDPVLRVWTQRCLRTPGCIPWLLGAQRREAFWRRQVEDCGEVPAVCETMRQAVTGEVAGMEVQAGRWWAHQRAHPEEPVAGATAPLRMEPVDGIIQLDHVELGGRDDAAFAAGLRHALRRVQAHHAIALVGFQPEAPEAAGRAQEVLAKEIIDHHSLVAEEEYTLEQQVQLTEGTVDGFLPIAYGIEDPIMLSLSVCFSLLQQIGHGGAEEQLLARLGQTMVSHAYIAKLSASACIAADQSSLAHFCAALAAPKGAGPAALADQWLTLRHSQKTHFLRAVLQTTAVLLQQANMGLGSLDAFLADPSAKNKNRFQAVVMGLYRAQACAINLHKLHLDHPDRRVVALVAAPQALLIRRALEELEAHFESAVDSCAAAKEGLPG